MKRPRPKNVVKIDGDPVRVWTNELLRDDSKHLAPSCVRSRNGAGPWREDKREA